MSRPDAETDRRATDVNDELVSPDYPEAHEEVLVALLYGSRKHAPRELAPPVVGQILRLDQPASSHVELLMDGRRIAEGSLIRTEEGIGVKITSIVARKSTKYAA